MWPQFVLGLVALAVAALQAQAHAPELKSPKQVIEEYFRMEVDGGRLTAGGWYSAGSFFVRPSPLPKDKQIVVIHKDYTVWQQSNSGAKAIVMVQYIPIVEINSALHFTIPKHSKGGALYFMALADKHWELGRPGEPPKEVSNSPKWLIDDSDDVISVNADVAIRYVTEMRDKTTDPVVRRNATQTLAKLKSIH